MTYNTGGKDRLTLYKNMCIQYIGNQNI